MLTRIRFFPPKLTGDATEDLLNLGQAIHDYFLLLENKGALVLDQATIEGSNIGVAAPGIGKFTTLTATTSITGGTGSFTDLTSSGNTILGDASTDTLNVGNGGIVKDTSGRIGFNTLPAVWGTAAGDSIQQFGVTGAFACLAGGVDTHWLTGARFDGTNWKYLIGGYGVARYAQVNSAHTFYYAAAGTAGNTITWLTAFTLDASGNASFTGTLGVTGTFSSGAATVAGLTSTTSVTCDNSTSTLTQLGYNTRASATQATSKATAVTCNGQVGRVTLNAAALAAGTTVSFTLNNSSVSNSGNENWIAFHESAGTLGAYTVTFTPTGTTTASIAVRNNTAGSLSEAIVIGFVKIGG